jgi:hypothetical protein
MSNAAQVIEAQSLVPQQAAGAVTTPMEMLDRAIASGAGMDVLEKLMALQERWEKNQARKAFDAAMADAKAEIPTITKNRTVDFTSQKGRTNYRHEDLAEIARTVDPIFAKHGLSYRFRTTSVPNEPVTVTCVVSHRDGYSEENTLSAGRDDSGNKNSIQAVGSTITYLQRYTLKAALGLAASNDDDGKTAEPAELIDQQQLEWLQTCIVEAGADIGRFCKHLGVEKLDQVTKAQYPRAIDALNAKKAAASKAPAK